MPESHLHPTPCLLCGGREAVPVAVTPPHLAPDRGERFRFVRCSDCGLVYLNPRPDPVSLDRYYGPGYLPHREPGAWGRWAPLVERAESATDRARIRRAYRALSRYGPASDGGGRRPGRPGSSGDGWKADPGIRVLDVGCGRPTFLRALQRATGWTCVGVDTSDAAWGDEPSEWSGLELRTGGPEDLDPAQPFDLITLWHVLEHAYEPRPFLGRLRELTRPGGALVVEVPDHGSLARRLQGESWIGYDAPRHGAAYEPETLRRILTETGWDVVDL
ncbi:MAG: class I SAM-dependent methyltransferase, partial [Gemmatimonadetes bacterium]|nr:class I SAM-dependent methyltransferase [Gemmatimonadota bacterium]NIU31556.1 class I SAM-dependent methyltransferase [Gemmatimonadota bacterium]NIW64637.1 methyltransferase domain-containing protein [Gemmatimonadota bacterium]